MGTNVNRSNSLVAATLEKANTYVLPRRSFGTVRSEVRILSPRQLNQALRLPLEVAVRVCGRIVADAQSYRFDCSSLRTKHRRLSCPVNLGESLRSNVPRFGASDDAAEQNQT